MTFHGEPLHMPDKDEVADYLQRYAERFELSVRPRTRIDRLERRGDRFLLTAGRVAFQANNVIVATGPFQRPKIPDLAARLPRAVHQLHSSEYTNPFDLPSGPALVVGVGNSGAQIALELAKSRTVWLAGRESGHLRRRILGRDLYQWIWPLMTKFTANTWIGRKLKKARRRTDPLIGIEPSSLRAAGIERVGKVTDVRDGLPYCDGVAVDPTVVVWCTGFTADYRWIDLPILGDDGYPRHERGVTVNVPGLYFLGLRFQHRMTSALVGGVGADAEYVVDHLVSRELSWPASGTSSRGTAGAS